METDPKSLFDGHRDVAGRIAWMKYKQLGKLTPCCDRDDWRNEAMAALWEAAVAYDPEKCNEFEPYALIIINFRLSDFVRGQIPIGSRGYYRKGEKVDLPIRESEVEDFRLDQLDSCTCGDSPEADSSDEFEWLLKSATRTQANVMRRVFAGDCPTREEVASAMGRSHHTITFHYLAGVEKIRDRLSERPGEVYAERIGKLKKGAA